ncbi:Ribosomal RNA small subunit methyltransferase NEP1 [Schistosoma japonicum]|uniref:Ribosomal RNA small subunit methyltransferase NEP1 n=1 Tax=Schistosoma japonicum TaxID=6182 RepID=A0A4Z2CS49_SCHJA|nr:Ribosomal RNA small subunit methyltransferase NEP1 [Schistosoma japonicum]TNN06968.1 Ribosomal RNA small subunit methyltransferase NEP1 [Schistosoma japonicum]
MPEEKGVKLYILLDQAYLESIKAAGGKEFQLLNPDKHKDRILKSGIDIATVRPDITHQCLLMLLDSPLNRVGRLQVFIRTRKSVIIEINPKTRIPRTFDRFCGLMVQLLHKLSIHAEGGNREKLLKIVKNPITRHFPIGAPVITMSFSSKEQVTPIQLAKETQTPQPQSVVIVIGALAHGSVIDTCKEFSQRTVNISNFPLSAAQTCARICTAFEEVWDVENIISEQKIQVEN